MEGVISHIVFTVKNSRYDLQRIKRKKTVGFVAKTFPIIENEDEEKLIKILCEVAFESGLKIEAFNFCGDHVHAIIITDNTDISKIMGYWKGKSAYLYHHHNRAFNNESQSGNHKNVIQNLWAKGYYQKIITSAPEFEKAISYVNNNRRKHGLAPLSDCSTRNITSLKNKKE